MTLKQFAVIDTETTWMDDVMSVGIVIGESDTFELVDQRYYVLTPFKNHGGMYAHALYAGGVRPDLECPRETAMAELKKFLSKHKTAAIFAYNAGFDYRHLPELSNFTWHDIMKLAAYKQHNPGIPQYAECYGTGRLKRGYGVESVYRMLSNDYDYYETHNALCDAVDELKIMKLLNHKIERYRGI